jgi:hypothetical protein
VASPSTKTEYQTLSPLSNYVVVAHLCVPRVATKADMWVHPDGIDFQRGLPLALGF